MGAAMSKRLKLLSAPEAEMEERSFPNPYPDWEPQDPSADAADQRNEPLDAEGKVAMPTLANADFIKARLTLA